MEAIVTAIRDREHKRNKFMAAMQGIDLDAEISKETSAEKFRKAQLRAQAALEGRSVEQVEFDDIGIGMETDEDEIE